MNKAWTFVLGGVTALLLFTSYYGLWDLNRHTLELHAGTYDLPFGVNVPWWFAGDLFVSMGMAALALIWFYVIRRKN